MFFIIFDFLEVRFVQTKIVKIFYTLLPFEKNVEIK